MGEVERQHLRAPRDGACGGQLAVGAQARRSDNGYHCVCLASAALAWETCWREREHVALGALALSMWSRSRLESREGMRALYARLDVGQRRCVGDPPLLSYMSFPSNSILTLQAATRYTSQLCVCVSSVCETLTRR